MQEPLHSHHTDLNRLLLRLERLLDADALPPEQSAPLQAQAAAVRRSLAAGDLQAVRGHLQSLARWIEALVQADALEPAEGRALLETARRLLEENSG